MAFFQKETKFVVGDCYEFIRVSVNFSKHTKRTGESHESWIDRIDEVGDILDTPVYLGKYVMSKYFGSGNSRIRHDYFDLNGDVQGNQLLEDGSTRYRKVECKIKSAILNKGGKRNTRKNKKRSKKSRSKRTA